MTSVPDIVQNLEYLYQKFAKKSPLSAVVRLDDDLNFVHPYEGVNKYHWNCVHNQILPLLQLSTLSPEDLNESSFEN